MKQNLFSLFREFIKVIIIAAIAVPVVIIAATWTGPSGSPPGGNADAPINVGPATQVKYGNLAVNVFRSFYDAYLATDSGNVGIGTMSPGAKLEVAGQMKITGGSPGAGKVLTSDANGLASWQTLSGSGGGGISGYEIKTSSSDTVYCSPGKKVLGGGCNPFCTGPMICGNVAASYPLGQNGWKCNVGGSGVNKTYAICANINP